MFESTGVWLMHTGYIGPTQHQTPLVALDNSIASYIGLANFLIDLRGDRSLSHHTRSSPSKATSKYVFCDFFLWYAKIVVCISRYHHHFNMCGWHSSPHHNIIDSALHQQKVSVLHV